MPRDGSGIYRFDEFRLDAVSGAVLGADGVELRLRPKAYAMLRHLLDNPGRLLGREELLDALWPGVMVTDDSLTQCVVDLRHALGDRAAYVLRTVPKRGYTLIAKVRRDEAPRVEARPEPAQAAVPTDRPSASHECPVMVHRFDAPDGDAACVLLADALVTDLVAELTHLDGLRVLPAMAAEVGEGYRVRGEVRAVGAELRVTIRLEDAATGAALWAERLIRPRDEAPELPRAVLLALAAHLGEGVERHSLSVARRKPAAALSARELCLIGRDHHQRATEEDTRVAKEMFARAIEADPDDALAYAWQAYTVHRAVIHGWGSPGGQAARDESLRLARRAVQLQPDSPLCLARLAFSLVLQQRWEEAVAAARAALGSGRPAFAAARNACCEVLTHAGHPEEAAEIAAGTLALDPLSLPTTHAILGRALLLAGRAEEALSPLRSCASRLPDYVWAYDSLVVAAVEGGHLPEALAARRELLRLKPNWVPRNHTGLWFFRRLEDLERFEAAYRRVDGPTGVVGEPRASLAAEVAPLERDPTPSPREPSVLRRDGAKGPARFRQETLVVHDLRFAPDDAAAAHPAVAIASDLMGELVRYEDLRIVAGPDDGVAQGFAMNGDVHAIGDRLCAHFRLDDIVTGTTFWAKRVEWVAGQASGFPVESIAEVAAAVDLQIGRKSLRRARQKSGDELSARELTALGKEHYHRSSEAETAEARTMFARATVLDPGYAPAHAWHALALARVAVQDWHDLDRSDAVRQAVTLARRAVELEPESPLSLASRSLSLAMEGLWEEAVASARLALRTGRVAGEGARIAASDVLLSAGHPAEAEEALRHAVTRDPHCSPVVHSVLGRALVLLGRPEEAVSVLRHCAAQMPDNALSFRTALVAAIEAGLIEDAREALRQLTRLRPEWVRGDRPLFWFLRREEDVARFQRAFEMATRLDATARVGGLMEAPASRA